MEIFELKVKSSFNSKSLVDKTQSILAGQMVYRTIIIEAIRPDDNAIDVSFDGMQDEWDLKYTLNGFDIGEYFNLETP